MQRGSTLWTVTRFPQAVQANWPFAKVPAGQNSTYSSSPAIADETLNCDSSTASPFTSGPWIASRSILLVGRQERSVNRLATTFTVHFRGGSGDRRAVAFWRKRDTRALDGASLRTRD